MPSQHSHSQNQPDLPSVSSHLGSYDSGRNTPSKQQHGQVPKRTRSPPVQYTIEASSEDSGIIQTESKRYCI